MTRPRVILGPSGAYLVRAVTRGKEPFLAPAWAAELLVATVAYFRHALAFRLFAYVVMPETLEAVIQPSAAGAGAGTRGGRKRRSPANISRIMMEIKGSFAHWYNLRLGRSGSVWEKRFRDRLLLTIEEIRAAATQVHARPVLEGLVTDLASYPYSGFASGQAAVKILDKLPVRAGGLPVEVPARRAG